MPRYLAGWAAVGLVAASVGAGAVYFVRDAVVGSTVVGSLTPDQVADQYAAAQRTAPGGAGPSTLSVAPSQSPSGTSSGASGRPTPRPTATASHSAGTASARPTATATPSRSAAPSPTPTPTPTASPVTGLLSSQGGSVVAQCSGSADNRRVYLVSWTPAQGYSVSQVRRGPSEEAEIEFDSASTTVTATIQCGRNGPEQEVEVEGYPGGGGGGGGGGDG